MNLLYRFARRVLLTRDQEYLSRQDHETSDSPLCLENPTIQNADINYTLSQDAPIICIVLSNNFKLQSNTRVLYSSREAILNTTFKPCLPQYAVADSRHEQQNDN